jgi:UDP-2-acetamido-2,6-beta-L-arabino-hexul-4-ose reductase
MTGAHGFLGWHTSSRLHALHDADVDRLSRAQLSRPEVLAASVARADVVLHLAGVNRAESDSAVRDGNVALADALADAVLASGRPVRVVYADSTQAEQGTAYGEGKAQAAQILGKAVAEVGGSLADVLLPNLFGEHGRPHYNSFVATFCSEVANAGRPTVTGDKEVALLHAQAAADCLTQAMAGEEDSQLRLAGERHRVSEVLELLVGFHDVYSHGEIPALTTPFLADLFNTYRSFVFPQLFPVRAQVHADARGELFETARSRGGPSQSFVSLTRPGATRGDHYHLHKVERFFVVAGEAEVCLRRLLHDEVVRFRLSGSEPAFVDMPTLWTHNITNVGRTDLVTAFWSNQLADPAAPDQYAEQVVGEAAS